MNIEYGLRGLFAAAVLACSGCVAYGYPASPGYSAGGPSYGRPSPGQGGTQTLRCESQKGRTQHCRVDTRGGVRLGRQLSKAACVQGRSWGHDRNGVWVSQGCRAEFVIGAGGGSSGGQWPGQGGGQVLRCESERDRYRRCDVRINRGVELSRQLSKTQCVQGNNWGWDRNGIWVDRGCRAEFRVR